MIRYYSWIWLTTLKKNCIVNRKERLEELEIPEEGLSVHLVFHLLAYFARDLLLSLIVVTIFYIGDSKFIIKRSNLLISFVF